MKKLFFIATFCAILSGCANTRAAINANNSGVSGAIGSGWRW
ncbi:lipoprotein [Kingella negevensis]|uniref:Lipoprotein n=1 Tax=Kingella negevensis TaxID=1522312 RepID=A0A238HHB0_9NEIS|nr:lipoprotein [Kingella negevensis]MDK4679615.1 lipoprotein [Kingella negevensis]MDK4679851.1 lipoprotein [Kingella negevensis]MDK4682430.1 lipoprotein [Kingella negevensis]MDK4682666.1 lipoprotein [Kingella negevensis]MDK4685509.1 lipoprotein [Kingella negevensis]